MKNKLDGIDFDGFNNLTLEKKLTSVCLILSYRHFFFLQVMPRISFLPIYSIGKIPTVGILLMIQLGKYFGKKKLHCFYPIWAYSGNTVYARRKSSKS